jgi:hypothetical protein
MKGTFRKVAVMAIAVLSMSVAVTAHLRRISTTNSPTKLILNDELKYKISYTLEQAAAFGRVSL